MRRRGFTKGLMTGAVIGAAISIMMNPMDDGDRRRARRKGGKFAKRFGNIIEDFIDMRR